MTFETLPRTDRFLDRLSDQAGLTEAEHQIFAAVGVTSWEDLDSVLRTFPSLADLGVRTPDLSFFAARETNATYANYAPDETGDLEIAALGAQPPENATVVLGDIAELPIVDAPAAPIGAGAIDLRSHLNWPVRDQNPRGTCVAFGAAACVEYQSAIASVPSDLSEQFLYWAIKTHTHDTIPHKDGAWLSQARDALGSHGICDEASWPYLRHRVRPPGGPAPSDPVIRLASNTRPHVGSYAKNPQGSAKTILNLLVDNRRPVALSLPVFTDPRTPDRTNNWTTRVGRAYGRVLNPPPGSVVDGGHCVCVTGFVPDDDEPTGGYFIIRNSWSGLWGELNPSAGNGYGFAPGYGDVSASYVDRFCWELFQL